MDTQTHLGGSAQVWDSSLGQYISEAHRTLATVLQEYKPTYSLVFIPEIDRTTPDERAKPYAILDSAPGTPPHIVRYLSVAEMQDTAAVLGWVFEGDLMRHRPADVMARIEARENAAKLLQMRQREAELEDILDFGAFAASGGRNKLHSFKHNGREFKR